MYSPRIVSLCIAFITYVTASAPCHAQEVASKLLGGEYAPTAAGHRTAYIESREGSCSGTLVGTNLVLTAGHCVSDSGIPSDYKVFVGSEIHDVAEVWEHSSYDSSTNDEAAAPYDLGMLVLSTPVTNYAPVPILTGHRLRKGEQYYLAGYGTNEDTWDTSRSFIDNFKIGATKLEYRDASLLWGTHTPFGSSICAGDSGGPAYLVNGNRVALVGVASIGLNTESRNECILVEDGEFAHVDLQSASSRGFLAEFKGVEYISYASLAIVSTARTATAKLTAASTSRSLRSIQKVAKAQRTALTAATVYASGAQKTNLQKALSQLATVTKTRSLRAAQRAMRAAAAFTALITD
jgi:V8-like Glu-specific endopeptidase